MQEVIDNDGPTLSVTLNRDTVAEGASATATIRRNTLDLSQPLLVTLESSDTTELSTPATVQIPAGASSITVQIAGIEDDEIDGDQVVSYMAKASGFNTGSGSIIVIDIDLADLVVSSLTAPASALTNSSVNVAWTIANNGYATAQGTWTERVYVSKDNLVGNDTLAGQYTFTGPLGEGQSYDRNVPVRLPNIPGNYWIVVESDIANSVNEGLETNNARITSIPITVAPAYSATVMTDVEMAPANTSVLLTGSATLVAGGPAAFQQVSVHLSVRGTKRVFQTVTDANGAFRVTFNPLPGEGGTYTVALPIQAWPMPPCRTRSSSSACGPSRQQRRSLLRKPILPKTHH